jgi:hypothetical protein
VEMVKSGLSETIIIAKIRNTESKFDTSTEALSDLTKEKVSDNVIAAMIDSAGAQNRSRMDAMNDKVDITLDAPDNGDLSEVLDLKKVYFYTTDPKGRDVLTKQIKKYPQFELVDSIDKAEFVIMFAIVGRGSWSGFAGIKVKENTGELFVVKLGRKDSQGKTHVRILFSIQKTQDYIGDAHPAKSSMEKFIDKLEDLRKKQAKD